MNPNKEIRLARIHDMKTLLVAGRPGPLDITRRQMLELAGLNLLCSLVPWPQGVLAAAEPGPPAPLEPLNRFPRMMQEYFVGQLRQFEDRNRQAKAALASRSDAEAYVQGVRKRIRDCFGPFPERTPLNPRVTGVVERPLYRIEKIIFESRPGFLVTSNLYVPKGRGYPLPGVFGTCGHSDNGKAEPAYQSFCQGLARMGYVVFIIDPIGQGERLQYPDERLRSRVGVGVREHLSAGNQQFLVGEFFGAWRAWDGIRALDYLLTREEVDPKHVGITGNSGGGTLTTWLCGLDSRCTMAAPGCFVTTFRRNLENELPADVEQCPPRALALGLDHEDFLAAMAPKPVLILAKEKDFFDIRGTEEACARLERLYEQLGAKGNLALFKGPTPHGYTRENREAMYRWFNRITGVSDAQTEPEIGLENDATLQCTPKGQVSELRSPTVCFFTRQTSLALVQKRPPLDTASLAQAVSDVLKLPSRQVAPDYRILRVLSSRKYPLPYASVYAVATEPGIHALVYRLASEEHESRPPQGGKPAVLYVSHLSSDAELREEPLIREMLAAEPGSAFYACDVRGVGESRPDTCGPNSYLNPYGSDYFYAIHALMLDYPYVGQKTFDVLRVLDWLIGCGHTEIHLAAMGWGALPATFSALLCPQVVQVTLKRALSAYADIAESETYQWPLSTFAPGVLKKFDLPDCYQALAAKKLRHIEPQGASRQAVGIESTDPAWRRIAPFFQPPPEYANQFGAYCSPLLFRDGTTVKTAPEWGRRREEILQQWHELMGPWPAVIEKPKLEFLAKSRRDNFTQHRVRLEIAVRQTGEGWLLIPDGPGPFPAVLVLFYEPDTSAGLNQKPLCDFAYQLTRRGFVSLSIGTPGGDARKPDLGEARCQPLSFHAYVAANGWHALANLPEVDSSRIGVTGHSYGGKWAMFAGALWDRFAAVAVSDPGIVFDETRPNVNYWEPWYLGWDDAVNRPASGLPTPGNPRTGAYKKMIETGRDLHELHALIAPRPFLVSGGSEDPSSRWVALNHTIAVNRLLGCENRVAMTTRPAHSPTPESNEQLYAFFEHFLKHGGFPR